MGTTLHRNIVLLLAAIFLSAPCWGQVVDPEPGYLTADGPYFIHCGDKVRTIAVDTCGNIIDTLGTFPEKFDVMSHDGQFRFEVKLHELKRECWHLDQTDKTFILSDPHGRMDCLVSILKAGGVIDENLKWSFGADRIVLIGDVMDRGDDVTQIYWLLYELQREAAEAGGSLSFLYGNHEAMVLGGDLRYTRDKYKQLADTLGLELPMLYGENTEIGRWLAESNTMMLLGDNLFVHAGLSEEMANKKLTITEINEACSRGIFLSSKMRKADSELTYMLFNSKGPVWYRGFFESSKKYGKRIDRDTLEGILTQYGAKRVFVGHTVFLSPRTFFGGKVVAVDVDAKVNRDRQRSRAVLIDSSGEYEVWDSGKKRPLHPD